MGPKYQTGKDGHDKEWEYAGEPEFGFESFETYGDGKHQEERGTSEFKYRDGDNIGDKSSEWPDYHDQELPEKM
jgi:hypothetical protein